MEMEQRTILAVDDEPAILSGVTEYLEKHGFRCLAARTGAEALALFGRERVELVLLDLMLPDIPGEEICLRIRAKSRVPIIMLTAKVGEENVVAGLAAGADGYVTKPFGLKELRARVEALLRRAADDPVPLAPSVSFGDGDLVCDFARGLFKKQGREVRLTATEQRILAALCARPGLIFSRDELIAAAFGEDFDGFDRSVDAHIKNLRRKIETDSHHPVYIVTVHGMGYRWGDLTR